MNNYTLFKDFPNLKLDNPELSKENIIYDNNIKEFKSGVEKLDSIFKYKPNNFALISEDTPLKFIITGELGTLKTTLLNSYLYNTIKYNNNTYNTKSFGVLFCQRETPIDMVSKIYNNLCMYDIPIITHRQLFVYNILTNNSSEKSESTIEYMNKIKYILNAIQNKGGIILSYLDINSNYKYFEKSLLSNLEDIYKSFGLDGNNNDIVGIDGINTFDYNVKNKNCMETILEVFYSINKHSICTFENLSGFQSIEYMADVLIKLSVDQYKKRIIEVLKARGHNVVLDKMILGFNGNLKIFPNLKNIFDYHISTRPRRNNSSQLQCTANINGFEKLFSKSNIKYIQRGSSTLIFGQPLTQKTGIAIKFLENSYNQDDNLEEAKVISLGNTNFNILDNTKKNKITLSRLEIHKKDLTEIFNTIIDELFIEYNRPYDRLYIRDLCRLNEYFDKNDIKDNLSYLFKICEFYQITIIITETLFADDIYFNSVYSDIFNCVICVKNIELSQKYQRNVLGICLQKHNNNNIENREWFEIISNNYNREYSIDKGDLDQVVQTNKGQFRVGDLNLWLYAESKRMLKHYDNISNDIIPIVEKTQSSEIKISIFSPSSFNDYCKKNRDYSDAISIKYDYDIDTYSYFKFKNEDNFHNPDQIYRGLLSNSPITHRDHTDVIMIDGYLIDSFTESGLLIDLMELDPEYVRKACKTYIPLNYNNSYNKIYGLPLYLNYDALIYDKNIIKEYIGNKELDKAISNLNYGYSDFESYAINILSINDDIPKRPPYWQELHQIYTFIKEVNNNIEFIDINNFTNDCASSFFIHYIFDIILEYNNSESSYVYKNTKISDSINSDFIEILKEIINPSIIDSKCSKKSLFKYSWLSFTLLSDLIDYNHLGVTYVPNHASNNTINSFRGDFYLSILEGSFNPIRGMNIIKDFLGTQSLYEMDDTKTALPPIKFGNNTFKNKLYKMHENTLLRSKIKEYSKLKNFANHYIKKYNNDQNIIDFKSISDNNYIKIILDIIKDFENMFIK